MTTSIKSLIFLKAHCQPKIAPETEGVRAIASFSASNWVLNATPTALRSDSTAALPRFQRKTLAHNLALITPIDTVAEAKGATVAEIVIAWALAQEADILPLVDARSREQRAECLGASRISRSAVDLAMIDRAIEAGAEAGARDGEAQMAHLDSERG